MPPGNLRGGKAYKKHKKAPADSERAAKFSPKEEGQDYARVVRLLGDRRAECFCNDGVTRIGKFRGGICKGPTKQKIETGDIILVSLRDFESDSKACDVLSKFSRTDWRDIESEEGIHPQLMGTQKVEDEGFTFGEEGDQGSGEEKKPETKAAKVETEDAEVNLDDL
jgi:translation initiation factor 1A